MQGIPSAQSWHRKEWVLGMRLRHGEHLLCFPEMKGVPSKPFARLVSCFHGCIASKARGLAGPMGQEQHVAVKVMITLDKPENALEALWCEACSPWLVEAGRLGQGFAPRIFGGVLAFCKVFKAPSQILPRNVPSGGWILSKSLPKKQSKQTPKK